MPFPWISFLVSSAGQLSTECLNKLTTLVSSPSPLPVSHFVKEPVPYLIREGLRGILLLQLSSFPFSSDFNSIPAKAGIQHPHHVIPAKAGIQLKPFSIFGVLTSLLRKEPAPYSDTGVRVNQTERGTRGGEVLVTKSPLHFLLHHLILISA